MKVKTPDGKTVRIPPGEVALGRAPEEFWEAARKSQESKKGLRNARNVSGEDLDRANDPANIAAEMMFARHSGYPHKDVKTGPDVGSSSVKTIFDTKRRLQSPEYHLHNGTRSLVLMRYDHETGEFFYRGWISTEDFLDNASETDGGNPGRPPILRVENRYLEAGIPPYGNGSVEAGLPPA